MYTSAIDAQALIKVEMWKLLEKFVVGLDHCVVDEEV